VDASVVEEIGRACLSARVDQWAAAENAGWPLAPNLPYAVALVMRHAPRALADLETRQMSEAFYQDYLRLRVDPDAAAAAVIEALRRQGHEGVQIANLIEDPQAMPDLPSSNANRLRHRLSAGRAA